MVYLKAAPATLLARLGDCSGRPLLRDVAPEARLARLEALLAERRVAYESASIVIDTDDLTVPDTVDAISRRLPAAEFRANAESSKRSVRDRR